jgi:hypothetical protein
MQGVVERGVAERQRASERASEREKGGSGDGLLRMRAKTV